MSPYAKRISNAAWEDHRDFIRLRYLVNDKSLENVRRDLLVQKGFSVTSSQLENRCKKWGFRKYLDKATWQEIGSLQPGMNHAEPVFVKGQHLSQRKVAKEMRRRKLLQCSTSSLPPLTQTAFAAVDLPLRLSSTTNGVAICPRTSTPQGSTKRPPNGNEEIRVAAFSHLDSQERASLLSKIINKAIDKFDTPPPRIDQFYDLLDVVTGVIALAKAAALGPAPFDMTGTRSFQATILRLWDRIFRGPPLSGRNKRGYGREDQSCSIISWMLVVSADDSILRPTVDRAFHRQLRSGYIQAALLLWPLAKDSWRPHPELRPDGLRLLMTLRTKAAGLLIREMISTPCGASLQLFLQSAAQYATIDDFKDLCIFCAARREEVPDIWSSAAIQFIFEGCVYPGYGDSAIEKLLFTIGELEKLGLLLQPSHVEPATFLGAARHGSRRLLEILLAINPHLGMRNSHGFSALTVAADRGHLDLCGWILQNGPKHDADSILIAIFAALAQENLEVCQLLETQYLAICQRQISVTEWRSLLCSCSSTSTRDHYERSRTFNIGHVEVWLQVSSDHCDGRPFCVVCSGAWQASAAGNVVGLQFYLDHGATIPPVHSALELRKIPTLLFSHVTLSCILSQKRGLDQSPGPVSARTECVELLISYNGPPHQSDIIASLSDGDWAMTETLMRHGCIIEDQGELLEAAILGQSDNCIAGIYQAVRSLYHAGALCASVAFSNGNALVRDIAIDIVSQRPPSDLGSRIESTAIALAALQDDAELFGKLLRAIPSPHPASWMETPWASNHFMSSQEVFSAVRFPKGGHSLERKAQIGRQAQEFSLLGLVSICDRSRFISALLEYGLQPDLDACAQAAAAGSRSSLQVLLQGRPLLHEWTAVPMDMQPLYAAIERWEYESQSSDPDFSIISQLLSAGADVNYNDGSTFLHKVVRSRHNLELARFLIDHGADINARCEGGGGFPTALYEALFYSASPDMIELLVACGANVNAPPSSKNQSTCLQLALRRYDFLEILISGAIKVDGENRLDYIIAVFEAQFYRYPLAALRLKEYGGWNDEDDVILSFIDSLGFRLQEYGTRSRIRSAAGHEMARREQAKVLGLDVLHQLGRTTPPIPEAPETWCQWPDYPQSVYQCGLRPGWDLGPSSSLHMLKLDLRSPPWYENEFDGWLNVNGPYFMRPRADCEDDEVGFFEGDTDVA